MKGKAALTNGGSKEEKLVGLATLSPSLGCMEEDPIFYSRTETYLEWIFGHINFH